MCDMLWAKVDRLTGKNGLSKEKLFSRQKFSLTLFWEDLEVKLVTLGQLLWYP